MELVRDKLINTFNNFSWQEALQVLTCVLTMYGILAFLRRNKLSRLIKYLVLAIVIVGFLLICFTSRSTDKKFNTLLLLIVLGVLTVILFISFRNEARREMFRLASPRRDALRFNTNPNINDEDLERATLELVKGCVTLAKSNTGALIVMSRGKGLTHIVESGTLLNSFITADLLECLFNTKAPLHDGAVIIENNKIIAAGCFLPLTQSNNLPKEYGTRHRAAIGISEVADVLTIVVSEETGIISVVKNGILTRYFDANMLTTAIEQFYGLKAIEITPLRRRK